MSLSRYKALTRTQPKAAHDFITNTLQKRS